MLGGMSAIGEAPVGVVVAGGRALRGAGEDAVVSLGGRPLLTYALDSMVQATGDAVVVAKRSTVLPPLGGVVVWEQPEQPSHPLAGIVEALRRADGRSVLVCAAEMPFVSPPLLALLAEASAASAPATIACTMGGALQPLLGLYRAQALVPLAESAAAAVPARDVAAALRPLRVPIEDRDALLQVDSDEQLARAEQILASGR